MPVRCRPANVPLVRTVRAINDFVRAVLSTASTLARSSVLPVHSSGYLVRVVMLPGASTY
jgi:hypothetical protein